MNIISLFPEPLKISEITFYLSSDTNSDFPLQITDTLELKPNKACKQKKEFILGQDEQKIEIDHYSFRICNVKFILPKCLFTTKHYQGRMQQITDISGYHITKDRPEYAITGIPYPITFNMSVDEGRPSCVFTCFVEIINLHKLKKQIISDKKVIEQGQTGSSVIKLEMNKNADFSCRIYVSFQSTGESVSTLLEDFQLSFQEPFTITQNFYDENNQLLHKFTNFFSKKRLTVVTHCTLSILVPLSVNRVEVLNKPNNVEATIVPFRTPSVVNPGETFTVVTMLKADSPDSDESSHVSLKFDYSPQICYQGNYSTIIKFPHIEIIPNLINVEISYNTIAYQFQPQSFSLTIKSDSDNPELITFLIFESDDLIIDGPTCYSITLMPKEKRDLEITFFALKIGEIGLPLMKIMKGPQTLWQASPSLFVMFQAK
ncbi:hypothetical protein GPJ56_005698 [Histomonas meleagridis]|uniref:uncharacterized protein n=1 Tax=Histomonas meleagridis TaxID=135588 RepID=UPI0035597AE6|nr:hypothetical protein GPJ56_005698 [Histomonas meleagridis]KAH0803367.1 hypothetical protein GO595_003711 [Histomonas meleagridis]